MYIIRGLLIGSFIYNVLLTVIYFSKQRLKNTENNLFSILLILNLVGIILEFSCIVFSGTMDQIGDKIQERFYVNLVARFYLAYLLCWVFTFMLYVYNISVDTNKKIYAFIEKKKLLFEYIYGIVFGIFVMCISFLPMYFFNNGKSAYTYGPAINVLLALFTTCVVFSIANMLLSFKKIKLKKYLPVFSFLLCVSLVVITKSIDPQIQLVGTILTFTTILMFFTIENPDLLMLNEVNENRQLIEKNYESNANFIFNLSQEVKKPINEIGDLCEKYSNSNSKSELLEGISFIKEDIDNLKFIASNILDVSTIDLNAIKIVKSKYNLYNLLNSIYLKTKQNVSEDLDFRLNIYPNVPEYLYGDEVKIKQIVSTIINNSVKYTTDGFIEIKCEALIKYDACRLIITIEDSGKGIKIGKLNDIISDDSDLTEEEAKMLDEPDLNIRLVNKIVKSIGGNILIKSRVKEGTKFTIVLEQRIVESDKVSIDYNKLINTKRILLVSDDVKYLEYLKSMINQDIQVLTSMYGKDVLDRINNNEVFDLIIISDEMKSTTAVCILSDLKKINYNGKKAVIIDSKKEFIKDEYLNDGFDEIIIKEKVDNDLKNILLKL